MTRTVDPPTLPAAALLVKATQFDATYWRLPEKCRVLAWETSPSDTASIYYQLLEPGRARLYLAYKFVAAVNQAFDDTKDLERREDTTLLIHHGNYSAKGKLFVPGPVHAHVTESLDFKMEFWIWATPSVLEMWGERARIEQIQLARQRQAHGDPFR